MVDVLKDISDGLERERSRETTGPMFVGSGHDQEWLPDEQEVNYNDFYLNKIK